MVALPSKNNLESVSPQTPRPQGGVVSVDLSGSSKGLQALGQGLQAFGQGVSQYQIAKDRGEYLSAKSRYTQKILETQNKLEQDNDYATYGDRFKKEVEEIKKSEPLFQQQGFLGNAYRDEFNAEAGLIESRAYEGLANLAAQKEKDVSRADLMSTIEGNSQALLQTPDEKVRDDLMKTTSELIDTKVANNHIDAETAFKLKRSFAENYSLNRFNLLTPQQQIQALNPKQKGKETYFEKTGTWSDAIPPEQKAALYDRAKDQIRIDADRAQAQQERALRMVDLQSKQNVISHIENGGDLTTINDTDWLRMGDADKTLARKLYLKKQGLASANPAEEDKAYFEYEDLYTNNPELMAKVDPLEIEVKVSPDKAAEVKAWRAKSLAGENPEIALKKQNEISNLGLREMGISPQSKKAAPFKKKFLEEVKAYEEGNGRKPNTKELRDIKDSLILDVTVGGFFFNSDKKLYQVNSEDYGDLRVPDDKANEIIQKHQKELGRTPTRPEVRKMYLKSITPKKAKGSFDLSFNLPDNVDSIETIKKAIDDERQKQPALYDGVDTEQKAKEIQRKYYRDLA